MRFGALFFVISCSETHSPSLHLKLYLSSHRRRTLETATIGMQVTRLSRHFDSHHAQSRLTHCLRQPLKGRVPWIACEDLREVRGGESFKRIHFNPNRIELQVCQKHICDLRQRLSETTKSSEFAHVDFAAVADDDVMSVAPRTLCNLPASPPVFFFSRAN